MSELATRTPLDDQPREILFVEMLGGFGDLLMALPAIHALARAHPAAALRVVTLAPGDSLLTADPAVTSVTVGDADDAAGSVARHLDEHPADLAVSTTMHSGIAELLEARVPRTVTNLWRSPPPDELVERRFLRLLADERLIDLADVDLPLRVVLTDEERARGRHVLAGEPEGAVLLLPGAGMPVKRWPAERWRQLSEALQHRVPRVWSVGDEELPGARPVPPLSLRQLAAFAAEIGRTGGIAIGGDTGPVRLVTAVGLPAVGLYGPTLAARYGLSDDGSVNLQGLPGCEVRRPTAITEQECWWSARCPLTDGGDPACLADLSLHRVLAEASMLGQRRADPDQPGRGLA